MLNFEPAQSWSESYGFNESFKPVCELDQIIKWFIISVGGVTHYK